MTEMTPEEAVDLLEGITKDMDGQLCTALRMAAEALKATLEPACEECMVHYGEDDA